MQNCSEEPVQRRRDIDSVPQLIAILSDGTVGQVMGNGSLVATRVPVLRAPV